MAAQLLQGNAVQMQVAQIRARVTVRCHADTNTLAILPEQGGQLSALDLQLREDPFIHLLLLTADR